MSLSQLLVPNVRTLCNDLRLPPGISNVIDSVEFYTIYGNVQRSCFANSILQCLLNLPEFIQACKSLAEHHLCSACHIGMCTASIIADSGSIIYTYTHNDKTGQKCVIKMLCDVQEQHVYKSSPSVLTPTALLSSLSSQFKISHIETWQLQSLTGIHPSLLSGEEQDSQEFMTHLFQYMMAKMQQA